MVDDGLDRLIRKHREGDASALRQVVERLHRSVEVSAFNALRSRGLLHLIPAHMGDMVNYVWADVFRNLHRFNGEGFLGWFAFRREMRMREYIRREARHSTRETPSSPVVDRAAPEALEDPDRRLLLRSVEEALGSLSAQEARLVRWRYAHGLSYAEIANLEGIRQNSVGSLLSRARSKLRERLKP